MAGESNADVYASLGVSSAVLAGDTVSSHEQAMLALDVAARDGDDAIVLDEPEEEVVENNDPYGNPKDPFGQEDDEDRIQVRVGEGDDVEPEATPEDSAEPSEGEDSEFVPVGDVPEDLSAASEQLAKHEEGFQEMVAQAAERGLSPEAIARIHAEYGSDDGISEQSYEELAKAGYSKTFVDSYIRGQEALVEQYVASVIEYAGGRDQFDALHTHLQTHNPEAADSLENALEARDLATVKAIINLAGQSRAKTFGRKPERSVTTRAIPAKPQAPKAEGFSNRGEMIKAMSDPRYRHDAAYRREVEQKVINSNF